MIPQNRNVAPLVLAGMVGVVFAFSLYVFLTTENKVIVINEGASVPKEVFVAGNNPPVPDESQLPKLNPRIRILETGVGFLNVREGASLQARQIGRVRPGEVYEYTEKQNNWYRIVHPEFEQAWVFGQYAQVVDRSTDLFGG